MLDIARQIDIPIVVSSALDSAVGIGRGLLAAARLPDAAVRVRAGHRRTVRRRRRRAAVPVDGYLPVGAVKPDPARLQALAAAPERRQWWIDRIKACSRVRAHRLVAE